MSRDQDLLREFAQNGAEAAFSELTRRYVDLVYSAALRLVRDSALAEDVSQTVFLALARSCNKIRAADLPGWLHQTTHHLAVNAVRTEVRRRAREHEAAAMNELVSPANDSDWQGLAPQLDDALLELSAVDRDALLRRYFQRQPAREMALVLGISDVAAQKRVNRAVDRLRQVLNRRGVAVGSPFLIALLLTNGMQSAPASLAATISAVAATGVSVPASKSLFAITKFLFMTTLQKTVITTAILAASGFGVYEIKHLSAARKGTPKASAPQVAVTAAEPKPAPAVVTHAHASRKISSNLPVPRAHVVPLKNSIPGIPFTQTQMFALLKTKQLNLPLAQVQPFLESNHRNAKSLLAAFRTTADLSLLIEAAKNFPADPQVALEVAIRNGTSSAERLPWLDVLRQASPDNSLPEYLAAAAHFQAGDQSAAVRDLVAASGKTGYDDFARERTKGNEEAYLAAGTTVADAKLFSSIGPAEPHLVQLKELGRDILGLANIYQQSGDSNLRESALQVAVNLGQRLSDPSAGETMLRQTVGICIERAALQAMDPDSQFDTTGLTVQGRLNQLTTRIDEIRSFANQADPLWKTLRDQDWVNYEGQLAANGEESALRWLIGKQR